MEFKFAGSPRNRYGTHASYGFKGSYEAAWRCHFSQIGGGALTANATGPIRGTVRRTEMIAAAMKPPCQLPGTDSVGPRKGPKSPLDCTYPEKPSDYGLSKWDEPEGEEEREKTRLSCSDLAVIKKAALAEIKRRAKDREDQEGGKGDLDAVAAPILDDLVHLALEEKDPAVQVELEAWMGDLGLSLRDREKHPWEPGGMFEYKSAPTEFKTSGDKGEYEGHFNVFSNVDDCNDIVHPGAFAKTIIERGRRVKVFYAHDFMRPIGPPPHTLKEDTVGLFAAGKLTLESFWGREAWVLMKDGALTEGSIGYFPIKWDWEQDVRNLREVKLIEISPVPLGANPLTDVSAVKMLGRARTAQEKLEVFTVLVRSLADTDITEENADEWETAAREVADRLEAFAEAQTAAEPRRHSALLKRQLRLRAAELALSQRGNS